MYLSKVTKMETSIIIPITVITIEKVLDKRLRARGNMLERKKEVRHTREVK